MPQTILIVAAVLFVLTGCAAQQPADRAPGDEAAPRTPTTVRGTVTYRARMALPDDATLHLTIEDVSRTDAPATILAEQSMPTLGKQVPIQFAIPFEPAQVDPTHRYTVRATILMNDGGPRFVTTQTYPVLTQNAGTQAGEIVLTLAAPPPLPTSQPATQATATVDASLRETYWKLVELNGSPVQVTDNAREPHLIFKQEGNRLVGSGGVNRLSGTYIVNNDQITTDKVISTKMAGPEAATLQEESMFEMLRSALTYRITGDTMEFGVGSRTVAKFKAVNAR
ncbi:MAG: YbaY family lipoprotein [Tepidisphaeraceae bacterium]